MGKLSHNFYSKYTRATNLNNRKKKYGKTIKKIYFTASKLTQAAGGALN